MINYDWLEKPAISYQMTINSIQRMAVIVHRVLPQYTAAYNFDSKQLQICVEQERQATNPAWIDLSCPIQRQLPASSTTVWFRCWAFAVSYLANKYDVEIIKQLLKGINI